MEEQRQHAAPNTLSPNLLEWIKLRKELEDRITDPELRDLLHRFIMADLAVCEEDRKATYAEGLAARGDAQTHT